MKLLIVDDLDITSIILSEQLAVLELQLKSASSGKQAIAAIIDANYKPRPSCF